MVEFPYRQRVGWILTYRSIVPCLSLLWAGQGAGYGSEKMYLNILINVSNQSQKVQKATTRSFALNIYILKEATAMIL